MKILLRVIGMWITNIKNKMFQQKLTILFFVKNFLEIFIHTKFYKNIVVIDVFFEHIN